MENLYLAHHGIKGMKWGVRRTPEQLGHHESSSNLPTSYPDVFKKKTGSWTSGMDMLYVNPGYRDAMAEYKQASASGSLGPEWYAKWSHYGDVTNCATCSVIFDLRQRGYDVEANSTQNLSMYNDLYMDDYYEGIERTTPETIEEMEDEIKKMGPNARGTLNGLTTGGGGHAIAWENQNGKVIFRDCQSGKSYSAATLPELYSESYTRSGLGHFTLNRLDRAKPNLDKLYENGIVNKRGTYNNKYGENEKIDAKIRDKKGGADPAKRQLVDTNNQLHVDKMPSITKTVGDWVSRLLVDSQTSLEVDELERRKR